MGFFGKSDDELFREKLAKMKEEAKRDENLSYDERQAKIKLESKPKKKIVTTSPKAVKVKKSGLSSGDILDQYMNDKKKKDASVRKNGILGSAIKSAFGG